MMTDTKIEWTKKAYKQLKRLPESKNIYRSVQALQNWPGCRNVKKLKDRNDYRLRVGRHRVIFSIVNKIPRIIKIEKVVKRNEHTY